MAYPNIKFKEEKTEAGVNQTPEVGSFVMLVYDGETYLACGADECDWFTLFPQDDAPFNIESNEVAVIKDAEVEITVK